MKLRPFALKWGDRNELFERVSRGFALIGGGIHIG